MSLPNSSGTTPEPAFVHPNNLQPPLSGLFSFKDNLAYLKETQISDSLLDNMSMHFIDVAPIVNLRFKIEVYGKVKDIEIGHIFTKQIIS